MNEILKFINRIPSFLRHYYFGVLFLALILFLAWGAWIFWQKAYLTVNIPPFVAFQRVRLAEDIFEEVKEALDFRQNSLPQVLQKNYPDIFR